MARNSSSSRFSSETGFFHSHSESTSLPLRMPQWQWRFLHSSLLQWKISLSTLNASSLLIEQFSLWNPLPQSLRFSFFLSLPLSCCGLSSSVLTALCLITSYMKWQLTSWGYSEGCLLKKSNTRSLEQILPHPHVCTYTRHLFHTVSHTHTPPSWS